MGVRRGVWEPGCGMPVDLGGCLQPVKLCAGFVLSRALRGPTKQSNKKGSSRRACLGMCSVQGVPIAPTATSLHRAGTASRGPCRSSSPAPSQRGGSGGAVSPSTSVCPRAHRSAASFGLSLSHPIPCPAGEAWGVSASPPRSCPRWPKDRGPPGGDVTSIVSKAPGGGPGCVLCPVGPSGCGSSPVAPPVPRCPAPGGRGRRLRCPPRGHRGRWPQLPAGIPFSPLPAEPSTVSILLLGCCGAAGWPGGAASYCTTAERRRSSPTQPVLGGRIRPPGELGNGVSCGPHLHPTCTPPNMHAMPIPIHRTAPAPGPPVP